MNSRVFLEQVLEDALFDCCDVLRRALEVLPPKDPLREPRLRQSCESLLRSVDLIRGEYLGDFSRNAGAQRRLSENARRRHRIARGIDGPVRSPSVRGER